MIIDVSYDQLKDAKTIFGAKFKIFCVDLPDQNVFKVLATGEGFAFGLKYGQTQDDKPTTFNADFPDTIKALDFA